MRLVQLIIIFTMASISVSCQNILTINLNDNYCGSVYVIVLSDSSNMNEVSVDENGVGYVSEGYLFGSNGKVKGLVIYRNGVDISDNCNNHISGFFRTNEDFVRYDYFSFCSLCEEDKKCSENNSNSVIHLKQLIKSGYVSIPSSSLPND